MRNLPEYLICVFGAMTIACNLLLISVCLDGPDYIFHQEPVVGAVTAPKTPTITGGYSPLGTYQKDATLSAAQALPSIPVGAHVALIQAEDQNIRWLDDGSTTVTASVGHVIYAGDTLVYDGDLSAIRIIEEAATATAHILYYGP